MNVKADILSGDYSIDSLCDLLEVCEVTVGSSEGVRPEWVVGVEQQFPSILSTLKALICNLPSSPLEQILIERLENISLLWGHKQSIA